MSIDKADSISGIAESVVSVVDQGLNGRAQQICAPLFILLASGGFSQGLAKKSC